MFFQQYQNHKVLNMATNNIFLPQTATLSTFKGLQNQDEWAYTPETYFLGTFNHNTTHSFQAAFNSLHLGPSPIIISKR